MFICCANIYAQLHCINYTSQEGLPSDDVICAAEDREGFLWFGTSQGACMFDGQEFQLFDDGAGAAPLGVYVKALAFDESNNLWMGTSKQGIYHYHRRQKKWTQFSIDQPQRTLLGNEIFFLHADLEGHIWFSSNQGGLGKVNVKTKQITHFSLEGLPYSATWRNRLTDLKVHPTDSSKFVVTGQGQIYHFDTKTEQFEAPEISQPIIFEKGKSLSLEKLLPIDNDKILVSTWNSGIYQFDQNEGQYSKVKVPSKVFQNDWRTNIFLGDEDACWVSFFNEGIARYNFNNHTWVNYQPEPFNRNGLLKGTYHSIFQSNNNHIWVCTSQGISQIIPENQAFQYFDDDVNTSNFFLDMIYLEEKQKYVGAFAGQNNPIKVFDQNFNLIKSTYFKETPDEFQSVSKIEKYEDQILCLAGQIYLYDLKLNKLLPVQYSINKRIGAIQDFTIDQDDMWLLIGDGTIEKYGLKTKVSERYVMDDYQAKRPAESIFYHNISIYGHRLWIATHGELVVFDKEKSLINYFFLKNGKFEPRDATDPLVLSDVSIKQVIPVSNDQAWVLTEESGLYLVKLQQDGHLRIEKHVGKKDLPQLETPIHMIAGASDDFWIATNNGLLHANKNFSRISLFNASEGLRHSKLGQGLMRIDDALFIGMPTGFAKVNVKQLTISKQTPILKIQTAEINNEDVLFNNDHQFNYEQNDFTVRVASPTYGQRKNLIYAHRLMPEDDDWRKGTAQQNVFTYDHLRPGKYTFESKAKWTDGAWSESNQFSFRIKPPFWKTGWFQLLSLVGILALGVMVYRLKLKRDLEKEKIQRQMAELENKAIRAQMNPHFIFNALNSIKSLILLDRKSEGINYLTKFSKMVREILNISKEPAILLQKELELLALYLDMESLRFHEKFNYDIKVDPAVNLFGQRVPPLFIQPFVENSIWHGLMHKEGDAQLQIRVAYEKEMLKIIIEDNGIGRAAAKEIKSNKSIFKKSSDGLNLSQSRIDLMPGQSTLEIIDLHNNGSATGTQVILKIPKNYGTEIKSDTDRR